MTTPENRSALPDESSTDRAGARLTAEAYQYLKIATERPDRTIDDHDRVIELLSMEVPSESVARELERRAAASGALAAIARDNPARLAGRFSVLADELRLELDRTITDEDSELRDRSRAIRDQLVSAMAHVIANDPTTAPATDGLATFVNFLIEGLTDETVRTAVKALFACANERGEELAHTTEPLAELLGYPDDTVQALTAGILGQVAEDAPDAVASTAGGLRDLLDHESKTVQHNTVEALGTLVRERPETVVPAADTLRELLSHGDVAIQHNAAGVLGSLAKTHPEAVTPAIEDLRELCTHEDAAVRRIATGALARLAQERPEAVAED